jgi:hypothetical protein
MKAPARPAKRTRAHLAARFDADNVMAAALILASPARYPCLPLEWARMVLEHDEATARAWRLVA